MLVVGAGPAGLSAALLFSKAGLSSTVIEKKAIGGPTTTSYDITEGYRISSILKELEITPHKISSKSEWLSPNHQFLLDSNIQDYYFKRGPQNDSIENKLLKKLQKFKSTLFFKSTIKSIEKKENSICSVNVESDDVIKQIRPRYVLNIQKVHTRYVIIQA